MDIICKRFNKDAVLPTKGSKGSAGFDLYALRGEVFRQGLHGKRILVPTGIGVKIPEGYYGRIAPRSGLSFGSGLDIMAGVIDSDYRGEIKVLMLNTTNRRVAILPGERIAQLIIEKIADDAIVRWGEIDETDRGEGGFGSTGA